MRHQHSVLLSNGIPVILQHEKSAVAHFSVWVQTGSADEKPTEAGFAHFLEHMLFKDTHAKQTGEPSSGKTARAIESLGGEVNAYTSFDQTVYHVTCAAPHLEKVVSIFGDMLKPKKFLLEDFLREREVVLEELRRDLDSPHSQLFHELFAATFQHHPYGRPIIGFQKTLEAATVKTLEAFYHRRYTAHELGLLLVGPIEGQEKKFISQLENFFGKKYFKKKKTTPSVRTPEVACKKGPEWRLHPFDVKNPTVAFSFRIPDLQHEDIPALDLLYQVLASGELSRLYQSLFYQKSWVTDVSGGLYLPKDPGMLSFSLDIEELEKILPVIEECFQQLKKLQTEPILPQEHQRVLVAVESEKLYATQTVDGVAQRLGFSHFLAQDPQFDARYLERLKALQPEEIMQVATKYFDARRFSGVLLLPKEAAHTVALEPFIQMTKDFLLPSAAPIKKRPRSSSISVLNQKKPVDCLTLDSGLRVCSQYRPQSPVMSVHLSALGGTRLELAAPIERAETDWGASHLMALTWTKGTRQHRSKQLLEIIEGHAASLEGFSGRNSVGLQLTCLAKDWKPLSELLTEVLLFPSFAPEELDHAKRTTEDALKSIEEHSSQVCSQLFLSTLFEKHPYGRISYGSLESIKKIHPEKLQAFHHQWIRPERLVVSLSGAVPNSVWQPWVQHLNEQLKQRQSSVILPSTLEEEPPLKGPRWTGKNYYRAQDHLLIGGLGIRMHDPDQWPLLILQTILEGQSGRLFIELREKKSLAYTVAPIAFHGLERGYLGTYIACAPSKSQEAIQGIQRVLEKVATQKLRSQELKRAQEYLLGKRAMDLQSDPARAAYYGLECLYNLPPLSPEEFTQKLRAVSEEDVVRVCQRYFLEAPQVTCQIS